MHVHPLETRYNQGDYVNLINELTAEEGKPGITPEQKALDQLLLGRCFQSLSNLAGLEQSVAKLKELNSYHPDIPFIKFVYNLICKIYYRETEQQNLCYKSLYEATIYAIEQQEYYELSALLNNWGNYFLRIGYKDLSVLFYELCLQYIIRNRKELGEWYDNALSFPLSNLVSMIQERNIRLEYLELLMKDAEAKKDINGILYLKDCTYRRLLFFNNQENQEAEQKRGKQLYNEIVDLQKECFKDWYSTDWNNMIEFYCGTNQWEEADYYSARNLQNSSDPSKENAYLNYIVFSSFHRELSVVEITDLDRLLSKHPYWIYQHRFIFASSYRSEHLDNVLQKLLNIYLTIADERLDLNCFRTQLEALPDIPLTKIGTLTSEEFNTAYYQRALKVVELLENEISPNELGELKDRTILLSSDQILSLEEILNQHDLTQLFQESYKEHLGLLEFTYEQQAHYYRDVAPDPRKCFEIYSKQLSLYYLQADESNQQQVFLRLYQLLPEIVGDKMIKIEWLKTVRDGFILSDDIFHSIGERINMFILPQEENVPVLFTSSARLISRKLAALNTNNIGLCKKLDHNFQKIQDKYLKPQIIKETNEPTSLIVSSFEQMVRSIPKLIASPGWRRSTNRPDKNCLQYNNRDLQKSVLLYLFPYKSDWLADEERFNDENPLWFSESSHVESPIFKLQVFRDQLLKKKPGEIKIVLVIFPGSGIINADDMLETWREIGVTVVSYNYVKRLEKNFLNRLDSIKSNPEQVQFVQEKEVIQETDLYDREFLGNHLKKNIDMIGLSKQLPDGDKTISYHNNGYEELLNKSGLRNSLYLLNENSLHIDPEIKLFILPLQKKLSFTLSSRSNRKDKLSINPITIDTCKKMREQGANYKQVVANVENKKSPKSESYNRYSIGIGFQDEIFLLYSWTSRHPDSESNVNKELGSLRVLYRPSVEAYLIEYYKQLSFAAQTKAVKAAIMSRNMSHNLGSHVMAYLKQNLYSVEQIIRTNSLAELVSESQQATISPTSIFSNQIELPFLVGLGNFINYLQERQDYIATVATDYVPFSSSVNFLEYIYDELKPDLRHSRLLRKNTPGRKPKNLLLDYIALSEGYACSNAIRLSFGAFDGHPSSEKTMTDLERLRELEIAMPGGIVGRQAFFSIIENIIRNAAKHGLPLNDQKILHLDFDIVSIDRKNPQLYKGWSNQGVDPKQVFDSDESIAKLFENVKHKYYFMTITNHQHNPPDSLIALKKNLVIGYINEQGQMIDEGKGIKEMRISAAWLRGYQIDTDIHDEPAAIYVRAVEEDPGRRFFPYKKGKYCAIQYLICLPKPHKVAVLFPSRKNYGELNENIQEKGCCIETHLDGIKINDFSQYEIVIAEKEWAKLSARFFSARTLYLETEEIEEWLNKIQALPLPEQGQSFIDEAYQLWYGNTFKPYANVKLSIYDHSYNNPDFHNSCANNVLFLTHYNGLQNLHAYENSQSGSSWKKEEILSARFVEGITGGNSTNRLIRENTKTPEWTIKHLTAGLTRIAIFDERLSRNIAIKKAESKLPITFRELTNFIKKAEHSGNPDTLATLANSLDKWLEQKGIPVNTSKLLWNAIKNKDVEQIKQLLEKVNSNRSEKRYETSKLQKYHEARIWFYDIIMTQNPKNEPYPTLEIIGYNLAIDDFITFDEKADFTHVGYIFQKKNEYSIEFNPGKNLFDFISIHQGILDKIYAAFNIKDNAQEKHYFTQAFHKQLSRVVPSEYQSYQDEHDKTAYYLPQLIIHSGRSKPSYTDMPQQQSFIPFAAIEHCVNDCKYMLTELLYAARYETSNHY